MDTQESTKGSSFTSGGTLTHRSRSSPGSDSFNQNTANTHGGIGSFSLNTKPPHGPLRSRLECDTISKDVANGVNEAPKNGFHFFRVRNKRSFIMAILAFSAISISVLTSFLGSMEWEAENNAAKANNMGGPLAPSKGHFLPSARDWGAGREKRKRARKHRAPSNSEAETTHTTTSDYRAKLVEFILNLGREGEKTPLSSKKTAPLGEDMSPYARLGCSVLKREFPITAPPEHMRHLWSTHFPSILEASRPADDSSFIQKNWTQTLLKSLSLDALVDGLSVDAMDPKDVERILGILVRRLLWLVKGKNNVKESISSSIPPPLRIAVFGGSTIEGRGCRRARVDIPHGSIMANPAFCAFPYRLEQFINKMLLPPAVLRKLRNDLGSPDEEFSLVEVINLGEEGTDSEFSTAIVRNRMYPPPMKAPSGFSATGYGGGPPDVVIHAYGVDDHGRPTTDFHHFLDAAHLANKNLKKGCPKEHQKPPPVVIRAVLADDLHSSVLKSPISIMTAVLGAAVDDVDEAEASLPPIAMTKDEETAQTGALGMAGHVASAWVLAFDLAYSALNYCANSPNESKPIVEIKSAKEVSLGCDDGIAPPCIFSFLAGPRGTAPRPSAIATIMMPYVVENTGWQPEADMTAGFSRKTGLVGTGTGATVTLLFRNVTRPVRRFDIITLRSTSEVWKDGVAKVVLVTGGDFSHGEEAAVASSDSARETSFEISAELITGDSSGENQHTSYHFGLDLVEGSNSGTIGTDILLRLVLTKGEKFKVLGLMLCE